MAALVHSFLVYKLGAFVLLECHDMSPTFGDIIHVQESHQVLFYVEVYKGY